MDRDEEVLKREEESKKPETTANRLVRIAENTTFFHDERGDGYAAVTDDGVRKTMRIRGRDFRHWLSSKYWRQYKSAANSEAMQSALGICEARAIHEGGRHCLSNRFAFRDGEIYIDLADEEWRAVRVSLHGWEITDNHPINGESMSNQLEKKANGSDNIMRKRLMPLREGPTPLPDESTSPRCAMCG